ncbi:MAG: hypothetical protein SV375_10575, partial [Thermodesulfobacteriota bacterium]|nr:hypothetical protein [Thermodesulfobacteriota bacterium]
KIGSAIDNLESMSLSIESSINSLEVLDAMRASPGDSTGYFRDRTQARFHIPGGSYLKDDPIYL